MSLDRDFEKDLKQLLKAQSDMLCARDKDFAKARDRFLNLERVFLLIWVEMMK